LNNWLTDLTEATAETLSFARRLDLDPAEIVDLLQSTPLGAPYAVQKARSMLAGDFSPAFALKHALKDAELATQAAQDSGATLTLTSALLPRWRAPQPAGTPTTTSPRSTSPPYQRCRTAHLRSRVRLRRMPVGVRAAKDQAGVATRNPA